MFKRILVPVDGSTPSRQAVTMAAQLAKSNGGQLRLVHVLDQTAYLTGYDPAVAASGQLFAMLHDSGKRLLDEAVAIAGDAGITAETGLVEEITRLGEAVAGAAASWGADLIVVGTHGRRGPSRLFLGSGAEQIIRLAPVPVLVTRAPESD
jgi:nucleotide-binding universal stress UspA family protein